MSLTADRTLIDASGVASAVTKLGDLLAGPLRSEGPVFLAGIPTRGVVLARRLKEELARHGIAQAGIKSCNPIFYRTVASDGQERDAVRLAVPDRCQDLHFTVILKLKTQFVHAGKEEAHEGYRFLWLSFVGQEHKESVV